MKRSLKVLGLAVLLVVGTSGFNSDVASANSEIKGKISDVQQKQAAKNKEAKQTAEEIDQVKQEAKRLNEEIRTLDEEISTAQQKVQEKRAEIADARERIDILKAEIEELEKRIAERDLLLKDRARSMYQSGGSIDYLEVILGAKSFGDFLDRISAVTTIAQQDKNIIEAHIADQLQLEETKKAVEEELQSLENHLSELEALIADLEEKRTQKDNLVKRLEEKEDRLNVDLLEIENASEILQAQEAALSKELAEYERQAALAAAEAARQQQAAASSSSNSGNGGSSYVHSAPAVTSAGFMRPATGSVTSTFGPRSTFGGRMHYGIDIGKNGRSGDVPIVAAQEGTVVTARYMNGYGNTVMIAHYVDGRLVTTLYGHMESLSVSNGQRVSKGQTIGIMGNTGNSYGAHLHFEVHEGGWNGAKSNAVDPLRYIPR